MNTSNVPLLGQDQPDTEQQPTIPPLTTAFVVFTDAAGRVGFSADAELLADSLTISRLASPDDMYGGCANVMRQITTQFTALETHSFVMSQARAAADAAQNAKIGKMVANSRVR
jgi:hypothetical protein